MSAFAETVTFTTFGPPDVVHVDVDLDDEELAVELPQPPGMRAATWAALDNWLALFPNALPEDQAAYWRERMANPLDPLNAGAVRAISYQVAHRVYGMPWWAAHRLTARAAANWWQYEAWAVARGFDPRTASAARIAASCWAWAAAGCEKTEDLEDLHRDVFTGPAELGHDAKLARGQAMLARLQHGRSG
ncbi:hypothetical protein [Streptomyces sp. NPDC049879]|uniref:hypothetical protein n=1 Tax=Streptomyces sp. NPDC049879 TaxID=3365598 RepID=UPI0037AD3853